MDNPAAPVVDNPVDPNVAPEQPSFNWKTQLPADFVNSPSVQKFSDTKECLGDAVKSYLSLEKMMGHEKVPVPKNNDDVAAWTIYKRAFGIPEKPDGYGLPDPDLPDNMKNIAFDKAAFQSAMHGQNLTPAQAKALWNSYTEMSKDAYAKAVKASEQKVTETINGLRKEWGDAYQSKVELGQMVINKFSDDKEMNDFITATLASHPYGVKFLSKIGDQFAENKMGDFKYQRHSLTPEEAQREIDSIKSDPNHPYSNPKASDAEHMRAVDYVNNLISAVRKSRG